jgi:hypothetical protein
VFNSQPVSPGWPGTGPGTTPLLGGQVAAAARGSAGTPHKARNKRAAKSGHALRFNWLTWKNTLRFCVVTQEFVFIMVHMNFSDIGLNIDFLQKGARKK